MTKNNRNDFDHCTALLFERLYQEFPKEMDISIDDLLETLDEEKTDNYLATIRFLQREGLIRYQTLQYDIFTGVTLTAKSLKILETISNSQEEEKTIASQISEILTHNNPVAEKAIIQDLIDLSV